MSKMKFFDWILIALVLVGALNWGLVGVFNFNVVTWLLGNGIATTIVYVLVGLAAIIGAFRLFKE